MPIQWILTPDWLKGREKVRGRGWRREPRPPPQPRHAGVCDDLGRGGGRAGLRRQARHLARGARRQHQLRGHPQPHEEQGGLPQVSSNNVKGILREQRGYV